MDCCNKECLEVARVVVEGGFQIVARVLLVVVKGGECRMTMVVTKSTNSGGGGCVAVATIDHIMSNRKSTMWDIR